MILLNKLLISRGRWARLKTISAIPASHHHIALSSAEIANLWGAYMGNSMSVCVLSYFVHHAEDLEIKEVLAFALSLAEKNMKNLTEIMNRDKFPIPVGFSEADLNLNAPKLYSDIFALNYLHQTTKSGSLLHVHFGVSWGAVSAIKLYSSLSCLILRADG